MSIADVLTRKLLEPNEEFAALFNLILHKGKKVILPEMLCEADSCLKLLLEGKIKGKELAVIRYRDILKSAVIKTDGDFDYLLLGIENQTEVDYSMPLRALIYDVMNYAQQIKEAPKSGNPTEKVNPNFRLKPVITAVLYYGTEPWTGPLSLREMFDKSSMKFSKFLPHYRLNLISGFNLSFRKLDMLGKGLGPILYYLKAGKKYHAWERLWKRKPFLAKLSRQQFMLLSHLTDMKIMVDDKQEVIDMCEAVKQIKEIGRQEGILEGRQEGILEGRQAGKQELIRSMWQNGLAMEVIAKIAEMTLPQVKSILAGI